MCLFALDHHVVGIGRARGNQAPTGDDGTPIVRRECRSRLALVVRRVLCETARVMRMVLSLLRIRETQRKIFGNSFSDPLSSYDDQPPRCPTMVSDFVEWHNIREERPARRAQTARGTGLRRDQEQHYVEI